MIEVPGQKGLIANDRKRWRRLKGMPEYGKRRRRIWDGRRIFTVDRYMTQTKKRWFRSS